MCRIYDELTLSDSDYPDYYSLTKMMAGLLVLEGSYESAIRKYIQLLDKVSLAHGSNHVGIIQKHVLVDVAEIYIKTGKNSEAQKCLNAALGMNNDEDNDISLAVNLGLLKILVKTDDIDSTVMIAGNIKKIILEVNDNGRFESDYEYLKLYCEACFEYIHYLNYVEQKVQDIELYQSCEETIDLTTTLVLNVIENAHRNSRLLNYDLLIDLYMLEGDLSLKPHKVTKLDYTDWAIIYFQQALKLYNKARQKGEHIDQKAYINLIELIQKLMKSVNKSSPSYFHTNNGGSVVTKKVDVHSNNI